MFPLILKSFIGFRSRREQGRNHLLNQRDKILKEERRSQSRNHALLGTESIISVGHWPQDPWQTLEPTDDQVLL